MNRVALGLAALATTSIAVAGCGSSSSAGGDNPTVTGTASTAANPCLPNQLKTVSPGTLTIGVDQPVFPPWFNDNKTPIDGKGFESAMDLAIASELGYKPAQIKVKRITFNQAIGPGAKSFDFDLDEFTITAARKKVVDFSAPYYAVAEAIVGMKGTSAASVNTFAGLKSLKLGAQTGTTDATTIQDVIKPSKHASSFGTNALAVQALKNHQIDGLVVDLPTAFYITSAQVKGSTIIGQLPVSGSPEQFGALLKKDSPLTDCVSKAIVALEADGQLPQIQNQWLAQEADAPVLK